MPGTGLDPEHCPSLLELTVLSCCRQISFCEKCYDRQSKDMEALVRRAECSVRRLGKAIIEEKIRSSSLPSIK